MSSPTQPGDWFLRLAQTQGAALWVLLFHALVWLGLSLPFDVHPDMADHWVWSRFLTWGYYEHPPMVALTMRLATMIGGNTPLTLKVGSVLFSVLILWLAYRLGREVLGPQGGLVYLLLLEAAPYFTMGSVFWHIDQPYMAFWLLGLWSLVRLVKTGNPAWMWAFGLCLGLGAESKYIIALLPLGFVVFLAFNRSWGWLILSPHTWGGALLCLGLLAPNLYWNSQHEWVTFVYNFEKGLTGGDPLQHFALFTLGHLILFSVFLAPPLWLLLAKSVRPWLQGQKPLALAEGWPKGLLSLLLCTGLTPAFFFTLTSFKGRGSDPHWVNVAYFGLFLVLAQVWVRQEGLGKRLLRAWSFNSLALLGLLAALAWNLWRLDYPETWAAKTLGWGETAQRIEAVLAERQQPVPPFVVSREYHLSGALSLYLKTQPWPHSIEKPIRNLWSPVDEVMAQGALVACPPEECPNLLPKVVERFGDRLAPLPPVEVALRGFVVRRLELYLLPPLSPSNP